MAFIWAAAAGYEKLLHTNVYLFIWFSVAPTPSWPNGDFQLLLVEEDLTCTNIRIFARMGRTTDIPQDSRKFSPQESFWPDQDSNPRSEGLSGWKLRTSTARPWTPLILMWTVLISGSACTDLMLSTRCKHYIMIYSCHWEFPIYVWGPSVLSVNFGCWW